MPRPVTTTRRITRSNSLPLCETAPLPRESPGPESRLSISLARSRDQADLSALVGFNIIDRVLNGPDLFRCVVRNFHAEFFFESHDQLDNVEAVSAQIVDEARLFVHLFGRSEEHTSELQSLMRHSYAVFCLNKKHTKRTHNQD